MILGVGIGSLALAPSLPERLPPNDYYVPFFFFKPKRETPALLCPTRTQLNKHLRPDPTAQRCVEFTAGSQRKHRGTCEKEKKWLADLHRDAGWSVPVGLGCDLTGCECQALLHCPPPPPGGAINTPAPSLLPRGAFPLSPPTGWLIGTRRWDIAIHACIPPGVCRADCRRRGNPPLPSRLNQPAAGHS
jgi:hypothetical protein